MRADDAGGCQGSSVEEALRIQRSRLLLSSHLLYCSHPTHSLFVDCVSFLLLFVVPRFGLGGACHEINVNSVDGRSRFSHDSPIYPSTDPTLIHIPMPSFPSRIS